MKAIGNAIFANGRKRGHRYLLSRLWDARRPIVVFGMLNPSMADAHRSDNTVSACIRMAVEWGYGGLLVVNAYSLVTTDPTMLDFALDPDGGEANLAAWRWALGIAGCVVLAWGNRVPDARAMTLLALIREAGLQPMCLARTKAGAPHHPRGLARGLRPVPFEARAGGGVDTARDRARARDYWHQLDDDARAMLGDHLVLGTLDPLDWFPGGARPTRAFLDELDHQRLLWEATT